jgi:hypothetical protein
MGLRALEAKYLLDRGVEEVFWYVHKLLTSLFPQGEGPSISVQTAKPFTYTNGKFVNKREKIERDFEFFFETKNSKTEMIFRWFYASDWASMEDFDSKFFQDIKLFNAIQRLMKLIILFCWALEVFVQIYGYGC